MGICRSLRGPFTVWISKGCSGLLLMGMITGYSGDDFRLLRGTGGLLRGTNSMSCRIFRSTSGLLKGTFG